MEIAQFTPRNENGRYDCPEYVKALIYYALDELEEAWCKHHQHNTGFNGSCEYDFDLGYDSGVCWENEKAVKWGRITYSLRPPDGEPNLLFQNVRMWFRGYGEPELDVHWPARQWQNWFDGLMTEIRKQKED